MTPGGSDHNTASWFSPFPSPAHQLQPSALVGAHGASSRLGAMQLQRRRVCMSADVALLDQSELEAVGLVEAAEGLGSTRQQRNGVQIICV